MKHLLSFAKISIILQKSERYWEIKIKNTSIFLTFFELLKADLINAPTILMSKIGNATPPLSNSIFLKRS